MSIRITIIVIVVIVCFNVCFTLARPQNVAGENVDVAAAIRYLQELETKHGQFARPRFGKRSGSYKTFGPYDHNDDLEYHANNYRISGMIHPLQDELQ